LRLAIVAAVWGALIIAAVYMLRAIRRIWHGSPQPAWSEAVDPPNAWRRLPFVLLLGALMVIGIWPRVLTDRIEPSARRIVEAIGPGAVPAMASAVAPAGSVRSDQPDGGARLEGSIPSTNFE